MCPQSNGSTSVGVHRHLEQTRVRGSSGLFFFLDFTLFRLVLFFSFEDFSLDGFRESLELFLLGSGGGLEGEGDSGS